MELSESADNRYFDLLEKDEQDPEADRWFSEAHLLRAMAVGFGASPQEDIADAVYELTHMLEDPSEIIALIESFLSSAASGRV